MENKIQGMVSILAALLVLFSAMLNPLISLVIAVVSLFGLGIWQLLQNTKK